MPRQDLREEQMQIRHHRGLYKICARFVRRTDLRNLYIQQNDQ